jgi:two-component system cell cycle response regulator DivK
MAKILIIEDTENNRILLTRRLRPRGFEIITAEDAEKGLPLVEGERPDLVLMDVGLPGMNGWDATRELKSNSATKHVPVIALTAHAMDGDREKAIAAGCDEYEIKPIDFNRLFEKIDRLLAQRPQGPPTNGRIEGDPNDD